MESTVRDSLRALIVRYGHALSEDPPRCEAMLRDLCGQHKREITVLIRALKQRVATDLLATSTGLPVPLLLGRLRKRLEDEEAMTAEAAQWAVETWALALGVIDAPIPIPAQRQASTPSPTAAPVRTARAPARTPPAAPAPPPPPAPVTAFRDRLKDGGEGPDMVRLPTGEFLMGAADADTMAFNDERPRHQVRIARPFAIGRFPVTFEEYDRFILATRQPGLMGRIFGGKPERPGDRGRGRGRRPVINVSWDDAVAYCVWLTEQTGQTYRLPSEAEWEYACRAGTETRWSCGDDAQALGEHAWFSANSGNQTHPVGEKQPNPAGLHDMHGNVLEWVQDRFHADYRGGPTDGSVWEDAVGAARVVRGGSWRVQASRCRCAVRLLIEPDDRDVDLGFRCARVQTS